MPPSRLPGPPRLHRFDTPFRPNRLRLSGAWEARTHLLRHGKRTLSLPLRSTNLPGVYDGDITVILRRIQNGEEQAADRLLPVVYDELRRLAAARMAHEDAGNTLQPTALVHEAWLRLGGERQPDWKSRAQFFAAAAEAMRRILIDSARRRLADRRRGRQEHIPLDKVELASAPDDQRILAMNEALEKFAADEPKKAEVVKLHFFGGLTFDEIARTLEISEPTARRWWAFSRAWLIDAMANPQG